MVYQNTLDNKAINKDPKKLLSLVLILTSVVLIGLGADIFLKHKQETMDLKKSLKIEELRGEILRLDEVLTMSARMAAVTGDLLWEQRYRDHEPKLDHIIKEVESLAPESYSGQAAHQTDEANMKLVNMENQSFDLVRQKRLRKAQDILFSQEYEEQKKIYADGILRFAIPEQSIVNIKNLRGKIDHFNEVLRMSAHMYIATANPQWEQRYMLYEVRIRETMKEVFRLASGPYSKKLIEQIELVNINLIDIENTAFHLVHEGKKGEAKEIFLSPEYQLKKQAYDEAIAKLLAHLHTVSQKGLSEGVEKTTSHIILVVAVILMIFIVWFFVMRSFNRWHLEFKQWNEFLDHKVQERTDELKKEQIATLKAYEELKATQLQLLQSEKLASIGQLSAGIAHEINNPVGFISANFQTLEGYVANYLKLLDSMEHMKQAVMEQDFKKAQDLIAEIDQVKESINLDFMKDDVSDLIQESQTGIDRIKKIVGDLRTFARVDKNSDLQEAMQIEETIESVLNIVQNEIKYKADLRKHYEKVPPIKGNQQRLGQVFVNLFINAVHAIENKGEIEIKIYKEGEYVCVDVKDTGKGIEEKDLKNIFDPFFTTKPVGQGTGLGLSISYDIVKQYGGDMKVASEVGVGTTFTVMLPIA